MKPNSTVSVSRRTVIKCLRFISICLQSWLLHVIFVFGCLFFKNILSETTRPNGIIYGRSFTESPRFVPIGTHTWLAQSILVYDWLICFLKSLLLINYKAKLNHTLQEVFMKDFLRSFLISSLSD